MEAALGTQLIHRTLRSFTLTDVRRDVYDHARGVMIEAEAAEAVVRKRLAEPSGMVRITTSVPIAQFRLADRLPLLARQYPKLRIQLHVTVRSVDLMQDGFDIAVRSHFAPLPDSGLMQRRIDEEDIALVAAPSYLAHRGEPATPEALSDHNGLMTSTARKVWRSRGAIGRVVEVVRHPRLFADESVSLMKAAESGLGIACLPAVISAPAVREGRLVRLLPGWTAGAVMTTILTPHKRGQLPAVCAAIDFLVQKDS